jgi:hypothetical protein
MHCAVANTHGWLNSIQLAVFLFAPFRSATVDSFLAAAFSSLKLVVNNRTTVNTLWEQFQRSFVVIAREGS